MSVIESMDALVERDHDHECEGFGSGHVCVRVVGHAHLPTRYGTFRIVAFYNNREQKDHVAIVHGDVVGQEDVLTRLHSECLTGDALGSVRCDCRDQLEAALRAIAEAERGVVLYMRQEGRGIGLLNKIRAYSLQDRGLDTVEANLALGFKDDERDYAIAAHMLHSMNVRSVALMTNNPNKMKELERFGVKVARRVPHVMTPTPENVEYLRVKAKKSGHLIEEE